MPHIKHKEKLNIKVISDIEVLNNTILGINDVVFVTIMYIYCIVTMYWVYVLK